MNIFFSQTLLFCRDNRWIFLIFFISLLFIWITNSWNIIEIFLIFILHFIWDIFIMMMWYQFLKWNIRDWTIYQISSIIIFTLIWIYALIFNWKSNYLIANFWFMFSAISSYYNNILNKKTFILWKISFLILSLFILWIYINNWLINNIWDLFQLLWFLIFPFFLLFRNEKIKYLWSFCWIFFITIWSFTLTYYSFLSSNITWVEISYALLPLTVLVYYIKNIKEVIYLKKNKK